MEKLEAFRDQEKKEFFETLLDELEITYEDLDVGEPIEFLKQTFTKKELQNKELLQQMFAKGIFSEEGIEGFGNDENIDLFLNYMLLYINAFKFVEMDQEKVTFSETSQESFYIEDLAESIFTEKNLKAFKRLKVLNEDIDEKIGFIQDNIHDLNEEMDSLLFHEEVQNNQDILEFINKKIEEKVSFIEERCTFPS